MIHSNRDSITLLGTADENWCKYCNVFTWIVNIQLENKKNKTNIIITICLDCLHKPYNEFLCKQQHCPFNNSTRTESTTICIDCATNLIESTKQCYSEIDYYERLSECLL